MFEYVPEDEVKEAHIYCADKMNRLVQYLKNEYEDWEVRFSLVGSGSRGLVTRNAREAFDLDYNLEISFPPIKKLDRYELKEEVRTFLDDVTVNGDIAFSYCQDSTSTLTARLIVAGKLEFSFDVAILAKNKDDDFCKLIHDKDPKKERYWWNKVPDNEELFERFDDLKANGYFEEIKELYLFLKNKYLILNDHNHPSFVVFKETINQIYNRDFEDN